jgi:N6-adenosine-specific RNA methylase IME4
MTRDDILSLPVADLAADDCLLFLWSTYPNLQQGLDTLAHWGFTYSTVAFTWAKTSRKSGNSFAPKWHMGLGYWTRSNAEICLLGYRGKPKRLNKDVRQLIISPVRAHSQKPDEQYERIERLVAGPYVELFARQRRPGWITWGNETDKWESTA